VAVIVFSIPDTTRSGFADTPEKRISRAKTQSMPRRACGAQERKFDLIEEEARSALERWPGWLMPDLRLSVFICGFVRLRA
jgi:hypothetical protein